MCLASQLSQIIWQMVATQKKKFHKYRDHFWLFFILYIEKAILDDFHCVDQLNFWMCTWTLLYPCNIKTGIIIYFSNEEKNSEK
jgi:hypothetical protein